MSVDLPQASPASQPRGGAVSPLVALVLPDFAQPHVPPVRPLSCSLLLQWQRTGCSTFVPAQWTCRRCDKPSPVSERAPMEKWLRRLLPLVYVFASSAWPSSVSGWLSADLASNFPHRVFWPASSKGTVLKRHCMITSGWPSSYRNRI